MKRLIVLWALIAYAFGYDPDEVQSVKSVKGGSSRYMYKGGDNISRFYNNQQQNLSRHREVEEIGVCYIEIPTAQLANDRNHVPTGNGSRPDLSRIRSCCRGYSRNIHDFMVCDPVCSKGCVNSLCVAPETCQCYPDYVKNAAGFCTATCPIGCQNGHCSGGECICDFGYKLDSESKYCVPSCKGDCGSLGNCTAPNTCSCQPGYQSTPEGSCKPACEHCENGECVAPNKCNCRSGFTKDAQGNCKPQCIPACQPNTNCVAPNVCSSSGDSQYHVLPINVNPLYPANQVTNSSYPQQHNVNQYPNPYNPNYPQGPHNQYPGNSPNLYPRLSSDRPHNDSHGHDSQISQRPDENFYPHQGPYPQPGVQNIHPGSSLPNNSSNLHQQYPAHGQNQQPNQYSGYPYPTVGQHSNGPNSSYPHRGDIDSDISKYPNQGGQIAPNNTTHSPGSPYPYPAGNYYPNYQESNSYYAGGRQQNHSLTTMNQFGYGSYDSANRSAYDYAAQGAYNRTQQGTYDSRNQGRYDSSQHELYDTSNQRSYDTSHHHSISSTQHGQYDSEYQSNYGNFNRDSQTSSAHGQYDNLNQRSYGNANEGTESSSNQGEYSTSQRGLYDSTRQESQGSVNQRNFGSHQGSYGTNQAEYPYYNQNSNPRQIPEFSNQVSNQTGSSGGSHHTTQQGFQENFDIEQQTNDVPVCSMPCINGYCVEGNECRCKPGYIPDRANHNICQPHCPGGCPNGVCSAPRLCLCDVGYYKDTSVKGRQVCVKRIK